LKETQLIKQILDYCRYRDLLFWRNQSGMIKTPAGGLIKFGMTGSPDIIGCYKGFFVGVECKVGKNKQTDLQIEFAKKIENSGGKYWLVYDIDQFISLISK
jgi:hypothetical protein